MNKSEMIHAFKVQTVDIDGKAGSERGKHAERGKGNPVHPSGLEGDEHDGRQQDHRNDNRLQPIVKSEPRSKSVAFRTFKIT